MPSIRNLAFILVSISALVYLVLQTSQGQRWLIQTQASEHTESVLKEHGDNLNKLKTAALNEALNRTSKSTEQDEQIKQLKNQLTVMSHDIAKLNQAMQEITELKNALAERTQEPESLAVFSHPDKPLLQRDKPAEETQFLAPVGQTVTIAAEDKLDTRQRQLEQQARLREVVQQMELTALQAINR